MTDRELMQQALEALDYIIRDLELRSSFKTGINKNVVDIGNGAYMQGKDAITALRNRLARQEQEPALFYSPKSCDLITERHQDGATNKVICATARTAEFSEPLYTPPPPAREWQGLTDEEIMDAVRDKCVDMRWPSTALDVAHAVLALSREKNHA